MTDPLLSGSDVTARLEASTWTLDRTAGGSGQIVRELEYPDFAAALAALNRAAAIAEEQGHHPDLTLHSWNQLRIAVSSHDAGGLTERDFALAAALDDVL